MAGKDTVATWGVDVQTGEAVDGVEVLAKQLQSLRDEMRQDKDELKAMATALANFKKGGVEFEGRAYAMQQAIEAKSAAVAHATLKYQSLGGRLSDITQKSVKATTGTKALKVEVSAMRGVLDRMQQGVANNNGGFQSMIPLVIRAGAELIKLRFASLLVGAAAIATGAGIAYLAKRLYDAALGAGNARRNELLDLEALTRRRLLYTQNTISAKEMQTQIDRVSASTNISRGEVTQLAAQLQTGGVRGKLFGTILEAASIKAGALGMGAGQAFAGFANDVRLAGGSAARAAQDVKNRFGDVVQSKMRSLEVQALKLKEAQDAIFSGIDTEPLLAAKKDLNDMFSQATATGRAMHDMATLFVQPLINAVTGAHYVVKRFFAQMIIGALELTLVYMKVRVAFHKVFGGPEVQGVWGKFFSWLKPGRIAVGLLAGAFGILAGEVIIATWPFLLAAAAIYGLVKIVELVYAAFTEPDWSSIGKSIVNGIVEPIIKAEDWVVEKVSNLARAIKNAFATTLKIQSPSKVFYELGLQIPAGVRQGIEAGKPDAQKSAGGMVDKPIAVPPAPASTGKPAAAGGGLTVNFGDIVVGEGADKSKAQEIGQAVRRELESVIAGLAEQLGASRGVAA